MAHFKEMLAASKTQQTQVDGSTPSPCLTLEQEEPFVELWTNRRRPLLKFHSSVGTLAC